MVEILSGVAGFVVLVAFVVVLVWFLMRLENKKKLDRMQQMQRCAQTLGFSFTPTSKKQAKTGGLHLFTLGHSREALNVMTGERNETGMAVFDYRYIISGGKSARLFRQTVARFYPVGLDLPEFNLRPEKLYHKIASMVGYQDIDFTRHPTFSGQYLLRGTDEEAIRRLFDINVITFFERNPDLSVDGIGNHLIVYYHNKRMEPHEMSRFIDLAGQVYDVLRKNSGESDW